MDTTAATKICWLYNPNVLFGLSLRKSFVVGSELSQLVWQHVGIRGDIIGSFSVLILHLSDIGAEPVLAGDLVARGEVVDALKLIKTLVEVGLA